MTGPTSGRLEEQNMLCGQTIICGIHLKEVLTMMGTIGNIATTVGFLALVFSFFLENGLTSRLLGVIMIKS